MVKTNRSFWMYFLLSSITCGIYGLVFLSDLVKDVNTVCAGDGENTSGVLQLILLSIITCGIYGLVWYYKLGNRLGKNAPRYGLSSSTSGTTLLLWMILLPGIGSLVAMSIIIKNVNQLTLTYTNNGARQM